MSVPAHLRALEVPRAVAVPARARVLVGRAAPGPDTARMVLARPRRPGHRGVRLVGDGGIAWRDDASAPWRPFPGVTVDDRRGGAPAPRARPLLAPDSARPLPCSDRIALHEDGRFTLLGRTRRHREGGREARRPRRDRGARPRGPGRARRRRDRRGGRAAPAAPRSGSRWPRRSVSAGAGPRSELARWLDPTTLPRRVRVVERLPREDNGKLTRRRLRALFVPDARVLDLEPDTRDAARTDAAGRDVRTLEVPSRPTSFYFEGHFPERPVLPGVVQLHTLVLRRVARSWPDLGAPTQGPPAQVQAHHLARRPDRAPARARRPARRACRSRSRAGAPAAPPGRSSSRARRPRRDLAAVLRRSSRPTTTRGRCGRSSSACARTCPTSSWWTTAAARRRARRCAGWSATGSPTSSGARGTAARARR